MFRPLTGGKRDETLTVIKEEVLTKKIKTLEIQLDEYKKKDDQNKLLRKLKVTRHFKYLLNSIVFYVNFEDYFLVR